MHRSNRNRRVLSWGSIWCRHPLYHETWDLLSEPWIIGSFDWALPLSSRSYGFMKEPESHQRQGLGRCCRTRSQHPHQFLWRLLQTPSLYMLEKRLKEIAMGVVPVRCWKLSYETHFKSLESHYSMIHIFLIIFMNHVSSGVLFSYMGNSNSLELSGKSGKTCGGDIRNRQ